MSILNAVATPFTIVGTVAPFDYDESAPFDAVEIFIHVTCPVMRDAALAHVAVQDDLSSRKFSAFEHMLWSLTGDDAIVGTQVSEVNGEVYASVITL